MAEVQGEVGVGSSITIGLISGAISFGLGVLGVLLGNVLSGLFGGGDVSKLAKAVNDMAVKFSKAIDDIGRFAWTVARAVGSILVALHEWFVLFLSRLWALIKDIASALAKLVKEALPAIAKAVKQARQILKDIYANYIRPILNWIQRVRRYLAILRALHVPYADKLDKILVRIEGRIIGPYLYLLRLLGVYGNWINVILTGRGVLQKPLFLRTMYAYQADWINLWWVAQTARPALGSGVAGAVSAAPPTVQEVWTNWDVYARTGGGPTATDAAQFHQYLDDTLAA